MALEANRRGHELADHLAAKVRLKGLFREVGSVFVQCEYKLCDVVAVMNVMGQRVTVAGEIERTYRNVCQNLARNLGSRRCDMEVIVLLDDRFMASVCRRLSRDVSAELLRRTVVVRNSELSAGKLREVLEETAILSGVVGK